MIEQLLYILGVGLVAIILGIFLNRESKRKKNAKNSVFALIIILFSLNVLVIGSAHTILHFKAWSDDSKQLFYYIVLVSFVLTFLVIGLQLFRNARQSKSRLALVTSVIWVSGVLISLVLGYRWVSKMNNGWTKEKENQILDRCNAESKFDCYCKLQLIKKTYNNPTDYYAAKSTTILESNLIVNCSLCDTAKNSNTIQKTEGLPDDF